MVKIFQILLQNPWTDGLETWYVALSTQVLLRVNLDIFHIKVKFWHIIFCMEKVKTLHFLETIGALDLKVGLGIQ